MASLAAWGILLAFGIAAAWIGSPRAIDGIHAVELVGDGYIHGSTFDCVETDVGFDCGTEIAGVDLEIAFVASGTGPGPGSCEAAYGGRAIECNPTHVTSSYWPHGVSISDAGVAEAASAQGLVGGWRSWYLGRSENTVLYTAAAYALFTAVVSVAVGGLVSRRYRQKVVLWVPLLLGKAVVGGWVLALVVLMFDYID